MTIFFFFYETLLVIYLFRYVDGAKAASSILVHDQKNVGALFLRGFCLYHKDNIDRAMTHFQQVIYIKKLLCLIYKIS